MTKRGLAKRTTVFLCDGVAEGHRYTRNGLPVPEGVAVNVADKRCDEHPATKGAKAKNPMKISKGM